MKKKALFGLSKKSVDELERIINSDEYDNATIENAKAVILEKNDQPQEQERQFSEFEQTLLKEVKKQSKDIREIKNSVVFFVVLTVFSIAASFFLWFFAINETNPLR